MLIALGGKSMIKNVLFDLDGTLINTLTSFNINYFKLLNAKFYEEGYDAENFSNAILEGLNAMINNDGSCSNEEAFWNCFEGKTKIKKNDIIGVFDYFYDVEYDKLSNCVEKVEIANKAISMLKDKGYNLILSTNPLFPRKAIEKRAGFGGINYNDFSYITSYENSCYAKPNVNYYKEIIRNNNLKIEETMMFGNDLIEDLVVEKTGVPCFIITEHMINAENISNCTKKGDYNEFFAFINNLPKIN